MFHAVPCNKIRCPLTVPVDDDHTPRTGPGEGYGNGPAQTKGKKEAQFHPVRAEENKTVRRLKTIKNPRIAT